MVERVVEMFRRVGKPLDHKAADSNARANAVYTVQYAKNAPMVKAELSF